MGANLDSRIKNLESQGDNGLKDIHVFMWGDSPETVLDTRTGKQITRAEFERLTAGENVIKINRETIANRV